MEAAARKLDEWVARVERALILACVTGMTVLVGSDVVQRTFSRPVGKTESVVAWLGEKLSGPLSDERRALLEGAVGNAVFLVLAGLFLVAATHAARRTQAVRAGTAQPAVSGSVVRGLLVLAGCTAAVKGLLWAFPSSVPGAQRFALGLMLWSGMLGASVAVREKRHIMLDTVSKKLDEGMKRPFALLSGLATALFCGFVGFLGFKQLFSEVEAWAAHEGVGLYESLPIPTWIATLAIPVSFTLMALRFAGYGIHDFRHGVTGGGDGGHGVDLEKLEREASVLPGEAAP